MCNSVRGNTLTQIQKMGIVLAIEGGRTPGQLANSRMEDGCARLASETARFASWVAKNPVLAHKYLEPPTSESPEARIANTQRTIRQLESRIAQCERGIVWMGANGKDSELAQETLRKLKRSLSGHKGQRTKLQNAVEAA